MDLSTGTEITGREGMHCLSPIVATLQAPAQAAADQPTRRRLCRPAPWCRSWTPSHTTTIVSLNATIREHRGWAVGQQLFAQIAIIINCCADMIVVLSVLWALIVCHLAHFGSF